MNHRQHIEELNYRNDHRVRAANKQQWYKELNTRTMTAIITVPFNNGLSGPDHEYGEEDHEVPFHYEVCPTCHGKGKHVNPSVDASGLTAEDFAEDPDFAEAYCSGRYDVPCYQCHGQRVVPVMTRDRADPELLKRLDADEEDREEFRRFQEAERRFGA